MEMDKDRAVNLGNEINDMLNHAGSTAAPAQPPAAAGDETFLGLTMAGFIFGALFSLIGVAYVVYAKKQSNLVIGLCGALLIVYTYFISNTYALVGIGVALVALPFILRRAGIDL